MVFMHRCGSVCIDIHYLFMEYRLVHCVEAEQKKGTHQHSEPACYQDFSYNQIKAKDV